MRRRARQVELVTQVRDELVNGLTDAPRMKLKGRACWLKREILSLENRKSGMSAKRRPVLRQ